MRPFAYLAKPVRSLLMINAAIFAFFFVTRLLGITPVYYLAGLMVLIPEQAWQIWRLVTYAFLHLAPMHFLFNMLILWMFGDELANWMGHKRFLSLYFVGAVGAALVSVPFYAANVIGHSTHILGASGALFALLVAYARFFPERQILIFFLFPMRIKYAIWIFIGIDLMLANTGSGVAHFTHLGGALAGWLFLIGEDKLRNFKLPRRKKPSDDGVLTGHVGYLDDQKELDAILQKVAQRGMQSLNPYELEFLQKASKRRRPPRRHPFK
ncbi:MAG: rhomboid family intramembrane serine protease [Fibrobacter sp.]|nr:rhomboid family intramembrane serine protease [Fibrobacter sp.]